MHAFIEMITTLVAKISEVQFILAKKEHSIGCRPYFYRKITKVRDSYNLIATAQMYCGCLITHNASLLPIDNGVVMFFDVIQMIIVCFRVNIRKILFLR